MWTLANATPFRAERGFVRDRNGAEYWVVAVKATYAIGADGTTELAVDQEPVRREPAYTAEPGISSLLYESDLPLRKSHTDVLLNGRAHAPEGKPAERVEVVLQLGRFRKALQVWGDRRWVSGPNGPVMTPPEPFVHMPINYERSYGGRDPEQQTAFAAQNPVGVGFCVGGTPPEGLRVPNVELVRAQAQIGSAGPSPAGFGAIAAHWQPRLSRAGTYDTRWLEQRRPLLPEDFDERFFQCAPEDQQLPGLRGGEEVTLHGLTPSGHLRFRLPRVALAFWTRFEWHNVEHRAALHSVIIEPDVPRVILVWHTHLLVQGQLERLRETHVRQKRVLHS